MLVGKCLSLNRLPSFTLLSSRFHIYIFTAVSLVSMIFSDKFDAGFYSRQNHTAHNGRKLLAMLLAGVAN